MTYFTDSPFERMMVQRPRHSPGPSPVPKPTGCRGCSYGSGKPCVGVCLKKTMETQKEGKQNDNA